MNPTPSILMITWNRREYFERTIQHLLSDPSDFRLYMWDNGSEDGVSDLVSELKDERIVARRLNPENVGQAIPWYWFMENCTGDIAGKLDDDILGERGWMTRFADMIRREPKFGTLGAWVFEKSDWDEKIASHKIVEVGPFRIFNNVWVPGGIFLGRKTSLERYSPKDTTMLGIPLDQTSMCKAGFINGFPLPLSFAEHLDDPRSPHCRMNRPGGWDQFAAYTARMRGFTTPEEYGRWIAADARTMLETSIADQLKLEPTRLNRMRARVRNAVAKVRSLSGARDS